MTEAIIRHNGWSEYWDGESAQWVPVQDNSVSNTMADTVNFNAHQEAWLGAHPERSREWLKAQLSDGFHIHHLDGDHGNNDPENLLLIDGMDHARLHASTGSVTRIGPVRRPKNHRPASEKDIIDAFHCVVNGSWKRSGAGEQPASLWFCHDGWTNR